MDIYRYIIYILDNSNKFDSLLQKKLENGVRIVMVYNCRRYDYSAGSHVSIYQKSITRNEKDINSEGKPKNENFNKAHQDENRTEEAAEHSRNVSLSATKNRIYNIARSNTWEWFITLTFDRNNIDASDYDMITRKLHTFMNNLQQRKSPDLKYLMVPELHADKEHYHFHGLLSDTGKLRFCFSGHSDKEGNPIFNMPDWKYGFTTATRVLDSSRVSGYIMKYITKDADSKLKNKKRYLCGRNIDRVKPEFLLLDEEYFLADNADKITYANSVRIPAAHQGVNYYELERGKTE